MGSVTEGSRTSLPADTGGYSRHHKLLAGGELKSQITGIKRPPEGSLGENEGQD